MRNRAYRATEIKLVNVADVVGRLAPGRVWVGMDIGKLQVLCVVRDAAGRFERPWRVRCPQEVSLLIARLQELAAQRPLAVAMEPTGTYGDALRQAIGDAGLELHRVSGKAAHDYAEIFDGVPSAHDGKDAAVVAELAAIGKSAAWPLAAASPFEAELAATVGWLDAQQSIMQLWLGRLEGLLSRHWPEATRLLALGSGTLLRLLAHYGGPAGVTADEQAAAMLSQWGRVFLKPAKIAAVLASARTTIGVRMNQADAELLKSSAAQALAARAHIRQAKRRLAALAEQDPVLRKHAAIVGPATACVLRVAVGDPRDYHCGEAYRKAMGLNLKERSSGKQQRQASRQAEDRQARLVARPSLVILCRVAARAASAGPRLVRSQTRERQRPRQRRRRGGDAKARLGAPRGRGSRSALRPRAADRQSAGDSATDA